jgi:hypothetical protein
MARNDHGAVTAPQPPTAGRTIWPGIGRGLAHEDLPKHLFTVAAMHARRALAAAEEPLDQLDRATSIGTSVELLAKAALTLISPTLIAERDPRSLLLYSGVPVPGMSAHEAKTKLVADCLLILRHSHSVNYNPQTDQKVFSVRNLALHSGQVDTASFNEALTIMTRLNEEILVVTKAHDADLDRTTFWGADLLTQVDERLKEDQEARKLELEELKAAARRAYERLQQMGLSDGALRELADRDPEIDDPTVASAPDFDPERPECPVCGYAAWLGYDATNRGPAYAETDWRHDDAYYFVDVTIEAVQFVCGACGLSLDPELLPLEGLDDVRGITVEATNEEVDALERYQIDSYLDAEYRKD